ncbi:MAG TPA: hypothetical protein VFN71_01545 [Methylomirabilota bacterium]|nr:hypothetical protein [Methylomirabilota bacterium]
MADEARLEKEVNARLERASRIVDRIDPARLGKDHREMLTALLDFVTRAKEALSSRDLPRADVLSDKAVKLADELAGARQPPARPER